MDVMSVCHELQNLQIGFLASTQLWWSWQKEGNTVDFKDEEIATDVWMMEQNKKGNEENRGVESDVGEDKILAEKSRKWKARKMLQETKKRSANAGQEGKCQKMEYEIN